MADQPALHVTDISQQLSTEPDGHGDFHDVYHVHFTTPSGTRTMVKVPRAEYTPENVAAQIHYEATRVEGVHALEGQELQGGAG